jgi:hypothetical protein
MNSLLSNLSGASPTIATGLLFLAFIVNMPEKLPAPIDRVVFLTWVYDWLHRSLKTFVSFRAPSATPTQKEGNKDATV